MFLKESGSWCEVGDQLAIVCGIQARSVSCVKLTEGLLQPSEIDVDLSVEERSTGWLLIASEVCCSNDFLNV